MQLERAAREAHQGKRDLEEQATEAQVGAGPGAGLGWDGQWGEGADGGTRGATGSLKCTPRPALCQPEAADAVQPRKDAHLLPSPPFPPSPPFSLLPLLPQAAQGELSKAASDFRRLHGERQELLQQWEGVLEAIRKRDAAILEAGKWWRPLRWAACRC